MDIGTILIWISLIFTIGVIGLSFLYLFSNKRYFQNYVIVSIFIVVLAITFAYILLTYYFITSNFGIHYVWANSGENLEWYLKLTGVWAGQEGSLLLWVWIILLAIGIEETVRFVKIKREKKSKDIEIDSYSNPENRMLENDNGDIPQAKDDSKIYDWTRLIVMTVVLLFLILLIMHDPFEPVHIHEVKYLSGGTGEIDPDDRPGGLGLSPMLRNMWMVIHPPLLFIGYGLITIPFAASLSYSITGDRKWTKISIQWSRLAWLFLTLGIGVGALWAYVAIGWGGYWFWDAVEVGSLVPWITLSAFLHTQLKNKQKNEYSIITPILGTITFVLIIFATYITRSGLWTSVHSWADTEIGLILLGTMIFTLIISALIIIRAFILESKYEDVFRDYRDMPYKFDSLLMLATIITFMLLTAVTFWGLIATMENPNPSFYETQLAPFIVILLIVITLCLSWKLFGQKNLTYLFGWLMISAFALAMVLPRYGVFPGEAEPFYYDTITSHHIAGFLIPFVILAVAAAIYKMIKQFKKKSGRNILRSISPHIIHLGVAFIIIAYAASQTMLVEKIERLRVGETLEIGKYKIKLIEIDIVEDTGNEESNEYWDTWFIEVEIYENDQFKEIGKLNVIYAYYYDEYGRRTYSGVMTSEVFVSVAISEDLYLKFFGIDDDEVEITAQVIPLMQFLWAGMGLFITGIAIRIVIDYLPGKKKSKRDERQISEFPKRDSKGESRIKPPRKKGSKDYDKMIEDELKKM
jgi:cytochrome c-type biogenesis protein CcmF